MMIKKTYRLMFTKQTNLDYARDLWNASIQKVREKFSVITVDDLLVADDLPDNTLAELEQKMGKTTHSFQRILTNSL